MKDLSPNECEGCQSLSRSISIVYVQGRRKQLCVMCARNASAPAKKPRVPGMQGERAKYLD